MTSPFTSLPINEGLIDHRYADNGEPWTMLPAAPIFLVDPPSGRALPAFDAGVTASGLLDTGVWQMIPPGLKLRLWLDGSGVTVDGGDTYVVVSPFGAQSTVGRAGVIQENLSASYRIRIGDASGWDTAAPFPVMTPPVKPTRGYHHGVDQERWARQTAALNWIQAWADLLAYFSPKAPVMISGSVIGVPYDGLAVVTNREDRNFLLEECFLVAENRWLGWDELQLLPLPTLNALDLPRTDPLALRRAILGLTVPSHAPLHAAIAERVVLRPATGGDRRRFVADRSLL